MPNENTTKTCEDQKKTDGDKKQHTPSSHLTYPRNASPPNTTLNTTSPRDRNGHAGRMGSPLAQPTARMEVGDVRVAIVVANEKNLLTAHATPNNPEHLLNIPEQPCTTLIHLDA